MAGDDFDVEALLEAAYEKGGDEEATPQEKGKGTDSPEHREEKRRKHKKKSRHRSRSRSRSRSPHRRRSRRSGSRSRSRSPHKRSHEKYQPSRRQQSRSPERFQPERYHRGGRRGSPGVRRSSPNARRRSRSPSFSPPYGRFGRGMGRGRGRGLRSLGLHGDAPLLDADNSPEVDSEERDRRTVMVMQLSARVGPKDLEEFFNQVGQVRDVKMISDRNSRKSKGIAYIEFHDEKSVPGSLILSGQKLFGVPMIVQPTNAEKNRLAAQAQNLKKAEGPRKLYVGSLHYNITEIMLKKIFESFGHIEKINIQRDENGTSKGYGFVEFRDSESAEKAMSNMNGFELAGRPMKVNHVTERDASLLVGAGGGAMEMLDGEDTDVGVGMTPQSRASLMAKLAEGHNAGLSVPAMPQMSVPVVTAVSNCFMLSNMFDPNSETEPGWDADIRDDVLGECSSYGSVLHLHVDPFSQGNVYVKMMQPGMAASAFNALNERYFDGKRVLAQYIPEAVYHAKFPVSMAAAVPLKPNPNN